MIFDLSVLLDEPEEPMNLYSIGVTVFEVNEVGWENLQTRVCVQLGKTKKYTKVKESSERPFFNEVQTLTYRSH